MSLNHDELNTVPPHVRADVGRTYNTWVRLKRAEVSLDQERDQYRAMMVKLRQGHSLTVRKIAALLGVSKEHVLRYSASIVDPSYRGPKRVKDMKADERRRRGKWARKDAHLAGKRPVPESAPSGTRTLGTLRDETRD